MGLHRVFRRSRRKRVKCNKALLGLNWRGNSSLSDIFQEVDEEVRREQLKKLWDRYGIYAVIAAFLVVAGIAAWRGYSWLEAKKAAEAGPPSPGARAPAAP